MLNQWNIVLAFIDQCKNSLYKLCVAQYNSMYSYLYLSEFGLNRRHALNDIFAILHIIIHDDHITQN